MKPPPTDPATTASRNTQDDMALLTRIAANYGGSILITDAAARILYANPAAERITGYRLDELIGETPALFKSGKTPEEVYRQFEQTVAQRELWKGEFINKRKDGELYLESKVIAAIRDASGVLQYYFTIGEEMARKPQYRQQIERLMLFDQLTGLPNRPAFLQELDAAIESASLGEQEMAVLHVDIDDFRRIPSGFGQDVSDLILAEASMRIREEVGDSGMVARVAADEFAIMLDPVKSGIESFACDTAERILAALGKSYIHADQSVILTASIGVICWLDSDENARTLLNHAVSATQQAKRNGGNQSRLFETGMAVASSWQRELLQALRRDEMQLHYQPKVNLHTGAIIGMEALVRWQHPLRGMVMPNEFIPQAEESSKIISLGEWVLDRTCRQMRVWREQGLPPVKVSVNLAARHFHLPGLPSSIAELLRAYRIDGCLLEIEITERAMVLDMSAAARNMALLKEMGVRISLDDFGTGYSSMSYLSRFPIDVVKIDQSFVQDITTNPANAAIAQATIAMSHKLGKTVLAEGVETIEQMAFLRRSECDEMQGYLFSRPLPADEIASMLAQNRRLSLDEEDLYDQNNTILLVDDEAHILSALRRTLRREGYRILTAPNAAEGFAQLARNSVQVIICDQHMQEMNGTQFLAQVRILYPATVRIVLSGYSEIATVTDAINKGAAYRFLTKPWHEEQLKEEVRGALRYWREHQQKE